MIRQADRVGPKAVCEQREVGGRLKGRVDRVPLRVEEGCEGQCVRSAKANGRFPWIGLDNREIWWGERARIERKKERRE